MPPQPDICPSTTALRVARQRALHQIREEGRLFSDPFAMRVLGETAETLVFSGQECAKARLRHFVAARQRIAEDALAKAVRHGMRQTVILGAGLDTFGLRNPFAPLGLRVFEVDAPQMQAWKRAQLHKLALPVPASLMYVPVNFETDTLRQRLGDSGFDPTQPAFFFWLGVIPYLTRSAITATLEFMGKVPHANVVFDYNEPVSNYTGQDRENTLAREQAVAALGEPWLSRFQPEDMASLLRCSGFSHIQDRDRYDLAAYFGNATPRPTPRPASAHILHAWR
ncbi:class I SAM-dependent methyltransferase [Acetobacter tropicalis]|uniref:class I SAM-dependent methyltransferase n=1 Tax=Acetobacter tropicalis TaxID=104102 RepID=UPI003975805F